MLRYSKGKVMRKEMAILLLFLCGVINIEGQTALEKAVITMNVSMNIPSFFEVSKNSDLIYVTPITEKDPLPTMAQKNGKEPFSGNTAFKIYFGKVHSILNNRSKEYLIFISAVGQGQRIKISTV